jgi:hypothetical protein
MKRHDTQVAFKIAKSEKIFVPGVYFKKREEHATKIGDFVERGFKGI